MQTLHHKKNELFEVEFFQDKECTIPFDFTNAKNLYITNAKNFYIELKNGDCTPLNYLPSDTMVFTPYIPHTTYDKISYYLYENRNICIQTLDDITLNISKYIPEDNAVLFLSGNCCEKYMKCFQNHYIGLYANDGLDKVTLEGSINAINEFVKNPIKKVTIFLSYGTQSELQKANEVAKELKEKYGVEEVNVFTRDCFLRQTYDCVGSNGLLNFTYKSIVELAYKRPVVMPINKIITTNSTGILEPQNTERLQVIDCKKIFEEYLKKIINLK